MAKNRKTGVELSKVLGRSQQAVSRRLTGDAEISLDELATIADWLEVSLHALLPDLPDSGNAA